MPPRRSNESAKNDMWAPSGGTTRTSPGMRTSAGLFDLREEEYLSGEERPYRERHRVEVSSGRTGQAQAGRQYQNYPNGTENRPAAGASGRREVEADLFFRNDSRVRRAADAGRTASSGRVLRGNTPGRRGRTAGQTYDTPERRGGTAGQTYRTPERRSGTAGQAYDTPERRSGIAGQAYRTPERRNRIVGQMYRTPERRGRAQYSESWDPEEYRRRIRDVDIDVDAYDRGYEEMPGDGMDGIGTAYPRRGSGKNRAEGSGRGADDRVRRRNAARREREEQLRRTYIRIGAGAVIVLFFLIVVPLTAGRLLHAKDSSARSADTETTQAQQQAAPEQETHVESGENDASAASPEEESPEDASPQADGNREEESLEESSQKEGKEGSQEEGSQKEGNPEDTSDTSGSVQTGALSGSSGDSTEAVPEAQGEAAGIQIGALSDEPDAQEGPVAAVSSHSYARQDEWNMIVVNPWNEMPADYTFETTSLPNGESVDSRCFGALTQMMEACRNEGLEPVACSAYRTHEKQIGLFEDQVKTEMAKGLDREEAEDEAATTVARPRTSEHELGLAVDICDKEYQLLDEKQADTEVQQWMMEHCWEYGFILRYPVNKGEITGIIYEPWHYRYVGIEAAKEMYNEGKGWICLEEYLAQ